MEYRRVFDHVIEVETYSHLDYGFVEDYIAKHFDFRAGMCSTAAVMTKTGTALVGRNMDLLISNKPAYVVRTAVPGSFETIGLGFFHLMGPDYEEVLEQGIPETYEKCLPFFCADVMNRSGLYASTNMRSGEWNPDGSAKNVCSGTNPNSARRVSAMVLPRYLCEQCETVNEALAYLRTLDIYTTDRPDMNWNFAFMLTDASGHCGVLEIARNGISWLDGQRLQTNFYLSERFAQDQQYPIGVGRYRLMEERFPSVRTRDDLLGMMDDVSCFQSNLPDQCRYDFRSELVGRKEGWTYAFVTAPENQEIIMQEGYQIQRDVTTMSRRELQDACAYWESTFTEIADCTTRTLFVRFFEDEARCLTLGFE